MLRQHEWQFRQLMRCVGIDSSEYWESNFKLAPHNPANSRPIRWLSRSKVVDFFSLRSTFEESSSRLTPPTYRPSMTTRRNSWITSRKHPSSPRPCKVRNDFLAIFCLFILSIICSGLKLRFIDQLFLSIMDLCKLDKIWPFLKLAWLLGI